MGTSLHNPQAASRARHPTHLFIHNHRDGTNRKFSRTSKKQPGRGRVVRSPTLPNGTTNRRAGARCRVSERHPKDRYAVDGKPLEKGVGARWNRWNWSDKVDLHVGCPKVSEMSDDMVWFGGSSNCKVQGQARMGFSVRYRGARTAGEDDYCGNFEKLWESDLVIFGAYVRASN